MAKPALSLREEMQREAEKLKERYEIYHNNLEIEYQRNLKRLGTAPPKVVRRPTYWEQDKKFNPYYVLDHLEPILRSVERKLLDSTYAPRPPVTHFVPKRDGTTREVNVYQIPDAAVSNLVYKQLLSKNRHRFSSLSYAYRDDRNVHFAIQDIALDFRKNGRVFIAEFDFRKFFDSIEHNYLVRNFDRNAFLIGKAERKIIEAFLVGREKGIPQGCSISLFLANLVCWELDRRLEDEGLRFARYADDTVVWSRDYGRICRSFEIIKDFSEEAGVGINTKKSGGISLVASKGMPVELGSSKEFVDFLGYRVGVESIGIKDDSVRKVKRQISYILYRNLLQPINVKQLRSVVVPANDRDAAFVTAVMQIRRYLYGNLTESRIRMFLAGRHKRIRFKGIMSFYPLIDDAEQLRDLDRWLVRSIFNVLRRRAQIFRRHGHNVSGFPFNLTFRDLLRRCREYAVSGKVGRVRIPSFLRIYRAIKRGLTEHGIERTMNYEGGEYEY